MDEPLVALNNLKKKFLIEERDEFHIFILLQVMKRNETFYPHVPFYLSPTFRPFQVTLLSDLFVKLQMVPFSQ